jgi:hypothetical protein
MGRAEPELPLLPWALRTLLLPMPRHLSMPLSRPPSMPQHRCHGRPSQHTLAVAMAEPKRELGAATAVSTALNYQAAVAYPLRLPLPRLRPARLGWAGACQSSRPWGGAVPVVATDVRSQAAGARGRANSGHLRMSRAVP